MKNELGAGISTAASERVHLDQDSHVDYTVLELKDIVKQSNDDLEKNFESHEADSDTINMAVAHYESILNTPGAFIGIGNTALVFKQHPELDKSTQCVKCRWDFLMVNNKSKKLSALPENLKRLKQVEGHFDKVKLNKNASRGKGVDIIPDSSVLREALMQRMASRVMAEAGMKGRVPDINFIVKIEREESGDVEGDPFGVAETVNLMFMEQIQGMNLEEIMYQASPEIAKKLDIDLFERELKAMVAILHKEGITHNDLTIRNIMLDSETLTPRIIDFGRGAYSDHLSDDDKRDDLKSVEEAVKFMKKFKGNPAKTAEELKDLQKLTI